MGAIRRLPPTIINNRNHLEASNRQALSSTVQQVNKSNKTTSTRARPSQATIPARTPIRKAATPSSRQTLQSSTHSKIQIRELSHPGLAAHPRDMGVLLALCHPIKTISKCHCHLAQWEKDRYKSLLSELASRIQPVRTR